MCWSLILNCSFWYSGTSIGQDFCTRSSATCTWSHFDFNQTAGTWCQNMKRISYPKLIQERDYLEGDQHHWQTSTRMGDFFVCLKLLLTEQKCANAKVLFSDEGSQTFIHKGFNCNMSMAWRGTLHADENIVELQDRWPNNREHVSCMKQVKKNNYLQGQAVNLYRFQLCWQWRE